MVLASRNGLTGHFTKANGSIIKQKGKGSSLIQTRIFMRETGQMTKQMAMEFMSIAKQELGMKGTGKMICSMDLECRSIVTGTSTRACLSKEKGMVRELTIMQLVKYTREGGSMVESKVLVSVNGLTVRSMKVSGRTIKNMVKAFIHGLMAESMKEIIEMIKSMDKEPTPGLTTDNILVNGRTTKDMVKVCM